MTTYYRATIHWLKQGESPLARSLYSRLKQLRCLQLPRVPLIFSALYQLYQTCNQAVTSLMRIFWWTPLFRSQVQGSTGRLYLYGGLPLITGGLRIEVGDGCRISGLTTFSARTSSQKPPALHIGNNVDVGWQTSIAVGQNVVIGNNVRIAGQCLLAGYPGHPEDARKRAEGAADEDFQVGDIVLEQDVWLATGVKIMAGVTIGQGSIVAAGSVVTKDLPAGVLAAGVPAKVIRKLERLS